MQGDSGRDVRRRHDRRRRHGHRHRHRGCLLLLRSLAAAAASRYLRRPSTARFSREINNFVLRRQRLFLLSCVDDGAVSEVSRNRWCGRGARSTTSSYGSRGTVGGQQDRGVDVSLGP